MTTPEIEILGPIRVAVNGKEIGLAGQKLRCILAILALRAGQPVRRDELIEELRLTQTSDASNSLHAHITRMRKWLRVNSLDPGMLESVDSSYRLNIRRDAVDAHQFEHRVEQSLALYPGAPSVVAAMLTEALAMWRGDALVDVDDGPFIASKIEELRHLRATAREVLLSAWLDTKQDRRVILNARRFLDAEPLNEQLWESLIVALRRADRYPEANKAYRDACSLYRAELGITPGERLRVALSGPIPERLIANR